MTKIEQKIPEGWSIDEFGKLALLSKKKYIPSPNEHIKCIELEHFEKETGRINGYIDSAQQSSTKNYFKKGDVLYGKLRPYLKKYTLASFDGICSTEIWVLQGCKEKLTNFYLYLIIQSNKFNIACNVSTGTHMPRADWEYVSSIPFILPPLAEQEKIAGILSRWDDGIEKLSALIEKKKIQKKALMQQLLTGKHRLKGFSTPWHEVRLGDVCKTFSGGTPSVKNQKYYGGNIPFVRSGEIHLDRTELFITNKALENSSAKLVSKGDVLYALYGATSGEADISRIDGAINQAILCIRSQYIDSYFLCCLLQNKRKNILRKYLQGGQGNLSAEIIKSLPIHYPCQEEQKAIAEILSKADEEIELLNKKLEAFKQEKKALMQQLLTGKIRVKVN